MISWSDFEKAVISHLNRDISLQNNPSQNEAIKAPLEESLFIVAGPGSGKTTAIALRILKLIFIDDIRPEEILATTFTRKAAVELKSRILSWGDQLRQVFIHDNSYSIFKNKIRYIDFNKVITGTIDSIAEDALNTYRAPGAPPPAVIENFVSNGFMVRQVFKDGRWKNDELREYLKKLNGTGFGLIKNNKLIPSEASKLLLEIKDRFFHDQIDYLLYAADASLKNPGAEIAIDTIEDYVLELLNKPLFDFSILESEFLNRLMNGTLHRFLENIRFVLVDEYQDTNLLQESIYFELTKAALKNKGSLTVVGDDDQSLYRFRGATVDLFREFSSRSNQKLSVNPRIIYLSKNYRSTENIVNFCNDFINLDDEYVNIRIGNKPPITTSRKMPYENYPVLGMFRENVNVLASDLASFVHKITYEGGVEIQDSQGKKYNIVVDVQNGGSPSDIVLLSSSPREYDSQKNPRLPLLLRNNLENMTPPINIFNPRGKKLEKIPEIEILCGLLLECIDPNSTIQNSLHINRDATRTMEIWREKARRYIDSNPPPTSPVSLEKFVKAWQIKKPLRRRRYAKEVPLIQIVYKLLTWIPSLRNDIEGLVYLEAVTRTIAQAGLFGNFDGKIIFDNNDPRLELSVKEAIWNIFIPISTGSIEINEELLETLPKDRMNIMSIHQSKGLEFPLVIVDIGSDFRRIHHNHAFKRFPSKGGRAHNLEDELRPYTPLGKPSRSGVDRAFDDLIRQYFVAFSRAQDVLLLVGLNTISDGTVPTVATGWDREEKWHWNGLDNLIYI